MRVYRVPGMPGQSVTIRFRKNTSATDVDVELAPDAVRLVLADADAREHHFGCGQWSSNGDFTYVATYTQAGRERIYRWDDIVGALRQGWRLVSEPQLGPILSPMVRLALADLEQSANKVNGFIGFEKTLGVRILRAVWDEAREPFDPDEIAAWAATSGWSPEQADQLRDIAEGVREGRRFRETGGRGTIPNDRGQARRRVDGWRAGLDSTKST